LRAGDGIVLNHAGSVQEIDTGYAEVASAHGVIAGVNGKILNSDAPRVHNSDHGFRGQAVKVLKSRLDQCPVYAIDVNPHQTERLGNDQLLGIEAGTDVDFV